MNKEFIQKILQDVEQGKISAQDAYKKLKDLPFKDLGFAKIDFHREIRRGFPETIFCKGKSPQQVLKIMKEMYGKTNILATKASSEVIDIIEKDFPDADIYRDSGIIFIGKYPDKKKGRVVVISAGTSDIPIAMESVILLKASGVEVDTIFDIGVSGIHRIAEFKDIIRKANIIIAVAGMDGVLPTVIAGLFSVPVIAVPTSIGYGASFSGITPLLTMLNSCAPGVAVVNIDNGYGAGYLAALFLRGVYNEKFDN